MTTKNRLDELSSKRDSKKNKSNNLPYISVVMPVRNEEAIIEQCLGMVLSQDYPHDKMEVLIADGMSTDRTREVISRVIMDQDIPVTVLDNHAKIVPTAMNMAIRHSRGEIIVRIDGHAIIQSDYIRQCVECLISNNVDCVGGAVDSVGTGYVGEAIAVAMSSKFGVGGAGFRTSSENNHPVLTDTVPFGAYKKEVFKKIGFFNEQMVRHQDYEFCFRLRKSGGKIMLLPVARAKYFVRSTLKSLWKQYWQYGIWKGHFIRKYPGSLKIRHLVPPVFVAILFISAFLALSLKTGTWLFGLTFGAYLAFIVIALLNFISKGNWKYLPALALILPCMHFSWGIGLWKGMFIKKKESL